jgi:hypothetical protein
MPIVNAIMKNIARYDGSFGGFLPPFGTAFTFWTDIIIVQSYQTQRQLSRTVDDYS